MSIDKEVRRLADKYAENLKVRVDQRLEEMESDDNSHYLIYQVLGVTDDEGKLIDVYQNKGRFLYKYAALRRSALKRLWKHFMQGQMVSITTAMMPGIIFENTLVLILRRFLKP